MYQNKLYTSHPMKIGKHQWRTGVFECEILNQTRLCTFYEWRKTGHKIWLKDTQWPTYNPNNYHHGIPRSLIKLHNLNKDNLDYYLGKAKNSKRQLELVL